VGSVNLRISHIIETIFVCTICWLLILLGKHYLTPWYPWSVVIEIVQTQWIVPIAIALPISLVFLFREET
jgi:hypothetical protein